MNWPATIARVNPDCEITRSEWVEFAQIHPKLLLGSTDFAATAIHVAGPRKLLIFWSNGSISCGAPTPEIIEVMFQCASQLNAVILGSRGHKYTSFEDWKKRTRKARQRSDELVKASSRLQTKGHIFLAAKLFAGILLGCLFYWILH